MDIFKAYTRRCLKENKTRTWVTIIGIVLSMALFTAVIEGAYSGVCFLRRSEVAESGCWSGYAKDLNEEQKKELISSREVEQYTSWHRVGWAQVESLNEYKPYLLIEAIDDNFEDLVKVNLVSGRMPENENEIAVPYHLYTNGGLYTMVGDVLELSVGDRQNYGGESLSENIEFTPQGEKIANAQNRTYTVVGIYERFPVDIEYFSCPGYIALTGKASAASDGNPSLREDVFIELKKPAGFYTFMEDMDLSASCQSHSDLLAYYGMTGNAMINGAIINFAIILVVMISFGSISLIYNSFSISVSERTKQFGILKSIGATKKQIQKSVLYEALLLAGAGIPLGMVVGCVGIGITLYCLRDSFSGIFFTSSNVQMRLVLNPWMLLLAVLACLLTTLISARRPAGRAIKISPIDSIRQSEDLVIKSREVRTSKLTQKLFGFEGMMASKNFKRNRKRCRSVILSLFMSIVLFVSASAFSMYMTMMVGDVTSGVGSADIVYSIIGKSTEESLQLKSELDSVKGVEESVLFTESWENIYFNENDFDKSCTDFVKKAKELYSDWNDIMPGYFNPGSHVVFIDDESFLRICESNNIDPSSYMKEGNPKALLYNHGSVYFGEDNKTYEFDILRQDALPTDCYSVETVQIDGYYFEETKADDQGNMLYYYFPEEYLNQYWNENYRWDSELVDYTQALVKTEAEASLKTKYTIGAVIDTDVLSGRSSNAYLIYPMCWLEAISNGDESCGYEKDLCFIVKNHSQVYSDMADFLLAKGMDTSRLFDLAENEESERMTVKVVNVFAFGFIILISLIALANVFNTITTSINLRRREFATLKSIGLDEKGFSRMMNYECIIYGIRGLMWGIPVSILVSYAIYMMTAVNFGEGFILPWTGLAIVVGTVFIIIFAAMLYATKKLKGDNPIDALKNENL